MATFGRLVRVSSWVTLRRLLLLLLLMGCLSEVVAYDLLALPTAKWSATRLLLLVVVGLSGRHCKKGCCALAPATTNASSTGTNTTTNTSALTLLINRFSVTRREISSPRIRRLCVLLLATAVTWRVHRWSLGASTAAVRGHQRVSSHRLPRCSHCRLPRGQPTGRVPPLPSAGLRTLSEASGRWSSHSLHQTEGKWWWWWWWSASSTCSTSIGHLFPLSSDWT